MKKAYLLLAAGALLLGAGCQNGGTEQTPPVTTTPDQTETPATLTITVEQTDTNTVRVVWSATTTGTWRMLNGSKPDPEYPEGRAYWYEVLGSKTEAIWGGIPSGVRHFRVCEFKNKECARYSNNVELKIE